MKLAYEIKKEEAVIWRCYDYGSEAELPEQIEGRPVTELAPYAFSAHMEEGALEQDIRQGRLRLWDSCGAGGGRAEEFPVSGGKNLPPALTGTGLTAVMLPPALRKIGAYAFYNCSRLRYISFCGELTDLGAGLFTGCHAIRELELRLDADGASCLREILIEVPEKLTVRLEGSVKAKLVFPEFFEESVENTPARILVIHTHGSGMNYRNCFYDRKFDFRAYDACFYHAKAEEDFDTVLEMTLARLMYPEQLLPEGRAAYEAWLREHAGQALEKSVDSHDMEALEYLAGFLAVEEKAEALLEQAASRAVSLEFPEGVSYLMDALHRRRKERREEKREEAETTGKAEITEITGKSKSRFEL